MTTPLVQRSGPPLMRRSRVPEVSESSHRRLTVVGSRAVGGPAAQAGDAIDAVDGTPVGNLDPVLRC